jgi:sterol desaturase/sphingolipid hydroxylase (fatty acid hydroxylase superfamily)
MEAFLKHASEVYAVDYFGIIIVVSLLECVVPRRAVGDTLRLRWLNNFGISILGSVLIRALFPVLGLAGAIVSSQRGWGLFNQVGLPAWLTFVLTLVVLDLVAYGQHRLLHRIPWLWRIHRTHHTDHDYDFTTGARFHPFETIFTGLVSFVAAAALGAPPVFVFASTLTSTFIGFAEHANVRTPAALDRILRLVLVTPEMHRIHHSGEARESQSNYGGTFPWWDRLLGTYLDEPSAGQDGIVFGVTGFEDRKHLTLPWMLAQPFLPENADSRDSKPTPDVTLAQLTSGIERSIGR